MEDSGDKNVLGGENLRQAWKVRRTQNCWSVWGLMWAERGPRPERKAGSGRGECHPGKRRALGPHGLAADGATSGFTLRAQGDPEAYERWSDRISASAVSPACYVEKSFEGPPWRQRAQLGETLRNVWERRWWPTLGWWRSRWREEKHLGRD